MTDTSYIEKAYGAWGEGLPDWICSLAKALDKLGAKEVVCQLGYSRPTLSAIVNNKYPHETCPLECRVRIQIMEVNCLLVGESISDTDCAEKSTRQFNFITCRNCKNYKGGGR